MAESWTLINQRSDEGLIDPKWMAYQKEDFRIAGKQGKFGIMHEQNSAYASQNNYPNFPEGEWMIIEAPVCPQGKKFIGPEGCGHHRAVGHHSAFQKYEDESPDVLVLHVLVNQAHEDVMVHRIEELGYIQIHHVAVSLGHVGLN